jgi:predicted nucleic acid-binding protein
VTTVFLDTVGLLALWDTSDQWHPIAEPAFARLAEARAKFTTTTFVLLECGNAAARRPYRQAVARLRERLEAAGSLIVPTAEDWDQSWAAYSRGEGDQAGIVDHVSFTVMRRLGLNQVFTHDTHFRAAGFEVLF